MVTDEELLELAKTDKPITYEELGLPAWRSECDGFYMEMSTLRLGCRCGIAYHHKDGYRWHNGDFFTKRECKVYDLKPGIYNK